MTRRENASVGETNLQALLRVVKLASSIINYVIKQFMT